MERMGEEKALFSPLKSVKRQKARLGRSVSTNFVADFSFSYRRTSRVAPRQIHIFTTYAPAILSIYKPYY